MLAYEDMEYCMFSQRVAYYSGVSQIVLQCLRCGMEIFNFSDLATTISDNTLAIVAGVDGISIPYAKRKPVETGLFKIVKF